MASVLVGCSHALVIRMIGLRPFGNPFKGPVQDLKITFDRVILPYGDLPVPAKVIQAKGFKVDKKGDIGGKGHAKRDVAQWMIPVLWPWKIVSLPMRALGPQ